MHKEEAISVHYPSACFIFVTTLCILVKFGIVGQH